MKHHIKVLKIYLVPLIFVFLFSLAKAEPNGSAFADISFLQQNDSLSLQLLKKKYEIANKLFLDENYSKSLELAYGLLESNDVLIKIKANLLLGKIFDRNNNNTALKHFKVSLELLDKLEKDNDKNIFFNDSLNVIEAEVLIELAKFYGKAKKESSYYLNRLIEIPSLNEKILNMKGRAYNNLSIIEFRNKNFEESEKYAFKAIEILDRLNKREELSAAYLTLANIYEVTKEREKALKIYFKALSYVENKVDAKSLEYKEALYYNIAWTLYNLKDYTAYEYLERSYNLKDTLVDVNLKKELKKIEQIHNIDLIRKEEENKRLLLERNTWLIGVAGILVSLLLLYLANLYKLRQKDLSLQLSQNELEQQKNLEKLKSESQVKILNAAIDGKETERKQIAETLHDNVSALLSSANMHLQASQKQFGDKTPLEIQKTQEIILEASQKIRDLSHNLVSSILLKFGLEYAVKDAAKKYSNSTIKIHTAISNVGRYSQDFEIKMFNIIQELINNTLKHSNATNAYITIEEENNYLFIIVKDNGVGFQLTEESKTGIGLNQIEARIHVLEGDFTIESFEKKGTKVMIKVPFVKRQESKLA